MSLQVWLPLNGDLHNQGLDSTIFLKTTENVWGTGKIGEKALLTSTGTKKTMVNGLKNKQNFSIAFWVKVDATLNFTSWQDIWALEYTNSTGTGPIRLEHTSTAGNCQLIVYKETNVGENTNAYYGIKAAQNYSNSWYHITLTKDQDNTKCYINGNLTNTSSNNRYEASLGKLTGNVTIGAATCAAYLNDVRIYDHALSAKEVEEISKGLVLHYPLNQLYDTNIIYDTSGYCNNGTIVGDITTITPSPRYNCCIEHLDSCADYIYREYLSFLGDSGFTFSCWINPTSYSRTNNTTTAVGSQFILSQGRDSRTSGTNNTRGASLVIYNGQPQFVCGNGILYANTRIPIGEWAHVVGVWTGTQKKIYVNGILKGSTNDTGIDWIESQNSLVIGKMAYGKNSTSSYFPFVGKISDVRIYATALTDNQIKELYNTSMQIDSSGNIYARELVEL